MAALLTVLLAAQMPAAAEPSATPALGGETQRPEDRRAALYREGVDAATAGRWTEARDRFRQTLAIRTSPKVLFSLAQAEEQLGQVASAQSDYSRALEGASAAGESEVVTAADQAQRALEPRVPHVRIVVLGAPPASASATLDELPVAVGTAVRVDPGAHRLLVSAPGMREAIASIAIGERQQLDVPVRMEAVRLEALRREPVRREASGGAGPPAAGAVGGGAPWRTVGLVTAGAGVVALGVSAALAFVAKSKEDQSNDSGCHGNDCTAAAAATRLDALSAANASTVAFVVGGVLAAGGVVLWLVAPPSNGDRAVGVGPVALAGGGGVLLTGRWR